MTARKLYIEFSPAPISRLFDLPDPTMRCSDERLPPDLRAYNFNRNISHPTSPTLFGKLRMKSQGPASGLIRTKPDFLHLLDSRKPSIVIPGPAQPEPGIQGPAPQPLKRLKGGAMDSGSTFQVVRNDGGMRFDGLRREKRVESFLPTFQTDLPDARARRRANYNLTAFAVGSGSSQKKTGLARHYYLCWIPAFPPIRSGGKNGLRGFPLPINRPALS